MSGILLTCGHLELRFDSASVSSCGCWLTVKLAHWLSHSAIFGPHDKIVQDLIEAWCIAKIRRLVGPMESPVNSNYGEEFALAEYLETSPFRHRDDSLERQFITVGTLRQELEKISAPKVSPELLDFIEFLLVVDHTKRPTAVEALQHPYLNHDLHLEAPSTGPH